MRFLKHTLIIVFAGLFVLAGCDGGLADLEVDNTNDPNRAQALANASDLVSLMGGATSTALFASSSIWGVHLGGLADQTTSTNRFLSFWDFTFQPRQRLNNRTTYADSDIIFDPWSDFNGSLSSANEIIGLIEVDGESIVLEDGTDVTNKLLASAYFVRGVSRGYLGMVYNQAYIVEPGTDLSQLEPQPYTDVTAAAVSDLDRAIDIASNNDFTWDLVPGTSAYSSAQLAEIANSFAARFLMNEPRTNAEASALPASRWETIIDYAENGVGASGSLPSFTPASVGETFFTEYADWNTFILNAGTPDEAGYLPTDLKIMHLLDPSYPTDYPDDGVLGEVESDDPRAEYYSYTEAFGFLNPSRDRSLFSNYWNLRMYANNAWFLRTGDPVPLITGTEMQYIKAEANLWLGNLDQAAAELNNSPRGTVPTDLEIDLPSEQIGNFDFGAAEGIAAGITMDGSETPAEFVRALHEEYSIELDIMAGIGVHLAFMRRHDLLQEGTPLHYPIPGAELEITQSEYYTFGGVDFAGQDGTASGSNSWKTFDERNDLSQMESRRMSRTPATQFRLERAISTPARSAAAAGRVNR